MQFFMNFILIIEFSLNLKFQIDLLNFSFEKFENTNCNVQKTEVVEHFDLLAHENGNSAQSCIYQKIEQVTLYKIYQTTIQPNSEGDFY